MLREGNLPVAPARCWCWALEGDTSAGCRAPDWAASTGCWHRARWGPCGHTPDPGSGFGAGAVSGLESAFGSGLHHVWVCTWVCVWI